MGTLLFLAIIPHFNRLSGVLLKIQHTQVEFNDLARTPTGCNFTLNIAVSALLPILKILR